MVGVVAVMACVLLAVVVVQYVVNEEIKMILRRLKRVDKFIDGCESRMAILEMQNNDNHMKLEGDYFNHMRDINELNKRMKKIERRIENENH